jgi:hypothetical protein
LKKYLPYILALLLAVCLVALFVTGNNKKEKQLDERITLRKQDKIPYGTYVAYKGLEYLFPKASIYTNKYEPGYWDSLSFYDSDQALIIVTGKFNADESEMKKLISFIEKGNDVFVCARTISYSAGDIMDCRVNDYDISSYSDEEGVKTDSLTVYLKSPPFEKQTNYSYPGRKLDASFSSINEKTTEVLGEDELGRPNFIRLRAGKGNFYIHLAPLAFSNYFLLHKENIAYYNKAFSVINPAATKVVWDEYYLNKKYLVDNSEKKGWFSVLMNTKNDNGKKPFKAAFWLTILLLLLYVLMEMRRKQRYIPVVKKPRNDSMDFVKTIGRLYFDKGDHKNLCRKMSAYFLEHVRNKYKLLTGTLNEEFIKKLQYKSGAGEQEISDIVFFIKYLDDAPAINHKQLAHFHKQLESFYKTA